jgi:hypothetical protein
MTEIHEKYLINEAVGKEAQIGKMVERSSGGKIKGIDKKLRVVFRLQRPIDEEEVENFDKIDKTIAMLEKMYPGSIVKHDWDKFIVEEL